MSFASDRRPLRAGLLVTLITFFAPLPLRAQTTAPQRDDWTRFVPGDVHLYVEFRDLSVTRHHLRRAGLWETVREFGRLGTPDASTQPWQERTSQLLGMSTEEAITRVLGLRTALLAIDPLRWDRGLVLAELGDVALVQPLLRRWQAVPLEPIGPVSRYRLPTGLLLAQRDRVLLFGPDTDDDGLWSRAVLLIAGRGGPSLSGNTAFRELSGAMPADCDGLIYIAGPQVARAMPLPPKPGVEPILVAALDVSAGELSLDVHARPSPAGAADVATTQPVAPLLPADSLAVWSGTRDLAGLIAAPQTAEPTAQGDPADVLRWAFAGLKDRGANIIHSLFGSATLVLGRLAPVSPDDYEQPTLTCLIDTRRPDDMALAMDAMVMLLWNWLSEHGAAGGSENIPDLRPADEGNLRIRTVPIGSLLARRTKCPFFERLELSWTAADGRFIVSTSRNQLSHVIGAIRGQSMRLRDSTGLAPLMPQTPRDVDWFFVRGEPLARMLQSWLDYVARQRPEAMEAEFWTHWAAERLEQQRRLGVGLRSSSENPNEAVVIEIAPDSPAAQYLRMGDEIITASGRPLVTTQPAREVAQRFRELSGGAPFALDIRRDGARQSVRIPLPPAPVPDALDFDPVATVKALIAVSEHIESLTFWRRAGSSDLFDARILLRWKPARP